MTIKSPSQAFKKPTSWASASGRSGSRMTEGSPQPLWTHHCLLHHTSHSSIPRVTTFPQMLIISFFLCCSLAQSTPSCLSLWPESLSSITCPLRVSRPHLSFLIFYAYFSLYLQSPSKYDYVSLFVHYLSAAATVSQMSELIFSLLNPSAQHAAYTLVVHKP